MSIKEIDKNIFREYDIRGIIGKSLSNHIAYLIGKGFSTLVKKNNGSKIAVGRDGRLSSPSLSENLILGMIDSGIDVIDIGCVPTPMLYFTRPLLKIDAAMMVTGSHNPPHHNGFKMMVGDNSLYGDGIKSLYEIINTKDFIKASGSRKVINILRKYKNKLLEKSGPFRPVNIVWDCGNGSSGELINELVKNIPGKHHVMFSEIDGNFPNHHPDPVVKKNLNDLIFHVKKHNADFGIAFDGDGDRIGVVDKFGGIVAGDLLTSFLAQSIICKTPSSKIIFDVKSSQTAIDYVRFIGGDPIVWKTGHSLIKTKMKELKAPLAGEMSGHIFFSDDWYGFDDAPYAALRIIQQHCSNNGDLNQFIKNFPKSFVSPEIRIECEEGQNFKIIEKIKKQIFSQYPKEKVLNIDGVRVSNKNGWWLVRASNTEEAIIARAESDSKKTLELLIEEISQNLKFAGLNWNKY